MYYLLPQSTNLHLFKIRIQKQMGGTGLGYCKVSHNVIFIILLVQIFCLKCIYHFVGLNFSYLSFCRFTLLNIQKILSFSQVIILQVSNLKILALKTYHFARLSFCTVIILQVSFSIISTGRIYHFPRLSFSWVRTVLTVECFTRNTSGFAVNHNGFLC